MEVKVRQGGGGDSAYVHLLRQKVDTGDQNNYPIGIAAALRVVQDGVEVDRVIEGGPAWLSGMKEGSVITAIDGKSARYRGPLYYMCLGLLHVFYYMCLLHTCSRAVCDTFIVG